ncbi:MAG TPA: hypothetical protein VMG80_03035, partial [Solirubrobacteraceae bacterium]|nr:hypothetical protein [Solirubrobacteraceae bacterium]
LVDNDGGGIFDFLAVSRARTARETKIYTDHVATPTGLDAARAAALYGLRYEPVLETSALRGALERALVGRTGSTIVHVKTDRAKNVDLHERVWSGVSAALASAGLSGRGR